MEFSKIADRRQRHFDGAAIGGWRHLAHDAAPLLLIVVLSFLAYLNADHEEFLFDDKKDVLLNPTHWKGIGDAFQAFWREQLTSDAPLTYLTFALTHAFNKAVGLPGADVSAFLWGNVAIHAMNACLVYLLLRALLRQVGCSETDPVWIPLAAAMLFAVHPMHASSVAYIIQRRGSLATLFCLLAVLCYLRARTMIGCGWSTGGQAETGARAVGSQKPSGRDSWSGRWLPLTAAAALCCWLSFRSKNMGMVAPLIILVVELCLRIGERRLHPRHLLGLAAVTGLCLAGMLVFLARWKLFDVRTMQVGSFGENADWGAWAHFLTESRVFVHYWKLLLLPLPQWSCVDHSFAVSRSLLEHQAVVAVVFHSVLLGVAVVAARRGWSLAVIGVLWFYVALVPYAVLPQAELLVEYKTYLPSIGLALLIAEVLHRLKPRMGIGRQVAVVGALVAVLLATTIYRNRIYQSPLALWADAAAKSPQHARPHYNYADALVKANRLDEAITHYEKAMRLAPAYPQIPNNLGIALMKKGKPAEAARWFEEAVRIEPRFAEAHNNLGSALCETRDPAKAVTHFREACRLNPAMTEARQNLATTLGEIGDALLQQDRIDEAVAAYREAIEVLPSLAVVHFGLGNAMARKGMTDEAGRCYQEAVRLKPDYPEALTNLGNVLVLQHRPAEAAAVFQQAIRCKPDLVAPRFGLAGVLAEGGQAEEAIRHYQAILQIDPNHQASRARLEALQGRTDSSPPPNP